jgi:hypothetical protein
MSQDNWTVSGLRAIMRVAHEHGIRHIVMQHAAFRTFTQIRACIDLGITIASRSDVDQLYNRHMDTLHDIFALIGSANIALISRIMPDICEDDTIYAISEMKDYVLGPYLIGQVCAAIARSTTTNAKKVTKRKVRRMLLAAINTDDRECVTTVAMMSKIDLIFIKRCVNVCFVWHRYRALDAIFDVIPARFGWHHEYFTRMRELGIGPMYSMLSIIGPNTRLPLTLRSIMAIARNYPKWESVVENYPRRYDTPVAIARNYPKWESVVKNYPRRYDTPVAITRMCPNNVLATDRYISKDEMRRDVCAREMIRDFIESDRAHSVSVLEQIMASGCGPRGTPYGVSIISEEERAIMREEIAKAHDQAHESLFA